MTEDLKPQFQEISKLLREDKSFLIASHQNPDPDAVASVLVFNYILKKRNQKTFPYLPDSPPKNLSFLPGFFEIKNEIGSFRPDVLLCLDYGDFKRMRIPEEILKNDSLEIITIDHHLEGDQRGRINVLKPEFSSTAEIIYYWLKYEGIEIDKNIANCLLAGIISDSGGFCHFSTTAETLNIVSELLLKGVSLSQISRQVLSSKKPLNLSRVWGKVLGGTKLDEKTGLAYSWVNFEDFQNFGIKIVDFDGIANFISSASPLNLGLFLVEYEKGKIKGSLRSEPNKGINVVDIARSFKGGGHAYAAGFQEEGTVEDVLKKTLEVIKYNSSDILLLGESFGQVAKQ
ncbi:MAG: bifunctional oligoribonuclease/PAP phosphatase NrnA [Candidatus Nealsonbacteria bacterium]